MSDTPSAPPAQPTAQPTTPPAAPGTPPVAPATPPQPPTPPPVDQTPPPAQETDDPTDWKAEARKWETRSKENSDAAAQLKEIQDRDKTEAQRLTDDLQAAKAESETAASAHLRLDVALEKAPAGMEIATIRKLAGRLQGSTREELEADAADLFTQFAGAPATPTAPVGGGQQTPVEQLRPGALPTTPQQPLAEQIAAAEAAGDRAKAMALKSQQIADLRKKQTN